MKIFESKNARLIILLINFFMAGLLIGLGSWMFLVNIIGVIPLLVLLFANK